MPGGLADLVQLANQYTGLMIAILWVAAGVGWKLIQQNIDEVATEVDGLAKDHQETHEQVNRVDQKQDHIVERQEMMLERLGMNEQEIQELREENARLDALHDRDDTFYRGASSESPGGD